MAHTAAAFAHRFAQVTSTRRAMGGERRWAATKVGRWTHRGGSPSPSGYPSAREERAGLRTGVLVQVRSRREADALHL